MPNACGCTPTVTCDGKCGSVDDGCGTAMDCGGCPAGQTCGGGGVPNVCGSGCVPLTCAARCGPLKDGCGNVLGCGGCPDNFDCVANQCGNGNYFCYPNLIPEISYAGSYDYAVGSETFTAYRLPISNWAQFPDAMFAATSAYGPCGSNPTPSRTWVDVLDSQGSYLYGFCAFGVAQDLASVWFGLPKGTPPPSSVWVELTDRACGLTYTSDAVTIP